MTALSPKEQQLVEQYMYIAPIAYNKILWINDLSAYKEEIISEGYLAICIASKLYNSEIDENPFPYFFKSALTRMLTFIKKFIFPQNDIISLEDNPELYDSLTCTIDYGISNTDIFSLIDDLITNYKYHVMQSSLSDVLKQRRTSDEYLSKLRFILLCLYLGYSQPEIGRLLKVSKQTILNQINNLKGNLLV